MRALRRRDARGHFIPDDAWVVRGRWIKHIDPSRGEPDEVIAPMLNAYHTARLLIAILVALPLAVVAVLLWLR